VMITDNDTDYSDVSNADVHAIGLLIFFSWFSVIAFIYYSGKEWFKKEEGE